MPPSSSSRFVAELGSRFADVRLIRRGSRFTIYDARDMNTSRPVTIKLPNMSSGVWLHDVLEHEGAILTAAGAHPHVLSCHELHRLEDGRPALLLERCTGSLYDSLHGEMPLDLQHAVAIGIKVAGGLEAIHQIGVLHCDVRPRTVFITASGEPALGGFDEAVEIADAASRPPAHHLTPHTAPEILEGGEPTRASDVYGLASTLYEIVAGRAAFRAYVGESPASVIVRVLSSRVPPILAAHVPLEVSDLLTWSLSPDPADRPPSPAWIAEELSRIERRQGWPRTRLGAA